MTVSVEKRPWKPWCQCSPTTPRQRLGAWGTEQCSYCFKPLRENLPIPTTTRRNQ